jgi:hypothetical protein
VGGETSSEARDQRQRAGGEKERRVGQLQIAFS